MIENISVKDIMSKNLITLHPKESIDKANSVFKEMDIHHIPIVVMNEVVGILSLGDMLCIDGLKNRNLDKHLNNITIGVSTIDEIMTINPICLASTSSLKDVLEIMVTKRINCVPVVNTQAEIVGLVTTHDVNKYLLKKLKD